MLHAVARVPEQQAAAGDLFRRHDRPQGTQDRGGQFIVKTVRPRVLELHLQGRDSSVRLRERVRLDLLAGGIENAELGLAARDTDHREILETFGNVVHARARAPQYEVEVGDLFGHVAIQPPEDVSQPPEPEYRLAIVLLAGGRPDDVVPGDAGNRQANEKQQEAEQPEEEVAIGAHRGCGGFLRIFELPSLDLGVVRIGGRSRIVRRLIGRPLCDNALLRRPLRVVKIGCGLFGIDHGDRVKASLADRADPDRRLVQRGWIDVVGLAKVQQLGRGRLAGIIRLVGAHLPEVRDGCVVQALFAAVGEKDAGAVAKRRGQPLVGGVKRISRGDEHAAEVDLRGGACQEQV